MPPPSSIPVAKYVRKTWRHGVSIRLRVRQVVPEALQYYRSLGNNISQWLACGAIGLKSAI
jgi:hypothetical protein